MRLISIDRYGTTSSIISLSLNHNSYSSSFDDGLCIGCVDIALSTLLDGCADDGGVFQIDCLLVFNLTLV
jgi:hypothetical protein